MRKLLWCPIDVPAVPCVDRIVDNFSDDTHWGYWHFMRLTDKQISAYDVSDWSLWTRQNLPELIEWFKVLPFKNLRNVKVNLQISQVKGHIDYTRPDSDPDLWQNNNSNEPCGYRIILKGSRQNCLWVEENGQRRYCTQPTTTDTYVLNHTAGYHGVDHDTERWTIFCHAEIDTDAHAELIERSLQKYSSYAIWDES